MAKKYGAYYYGHWIKDVPIDVLYRQYDQPGQAGHMTVAGCQLWAKNMLPLLKKVIQDKNIN